jgi:uncharacterized protein (TIGR02391 family)
VIIFWDDLAILALMYELHEAGSLHYRSGDQIMQEMGGNPGLDEDRAAFVRTIHVMAQDDLIAFELLIHGLVSPPRPESYEYLAHLRNFTIRTNGLDRARGIKIADPPPDPGEDDGRIISKLTLEEMASIIGACYSMQQTWDFLIEAGISVEKISPTDVLADSSSIVSHVLVELEKGPRSRRRELRGFIGAWLDDRLHTGPSQTEHEKLARDLERQGWFVRDGRLVEGEPVRGADGARGDIARDARIAALHPTIREVSQRPFEAGETAAAVLEAFKAVNNRVKERSSSDADGQPLMARVFRPGDPVLRIANEGNETGQSIQAGYHHLFMGAMLGIRNPHAHEHFPGLDENEALEQLGFASMLMRRLDGARLAGEG